MSNIIEAVAEKAYNIGSLDQIPVGEGRLFKIGHRPVAVFRTRQGSVFAAQALCPHKAGPLSDGLVGGEQVICPLHSIRFDLATGQPIGNDCKALKTYPVAVSEAGEVLISLRLRFLQAKEDAN